MIIISYQIGSSAKVYYFLMILFDKIHILYIIIIRIKQPDNRALQGEESPCIQGQLAGETPDGVSRWIGPQKGVTVIYFAYLQNYFNPYPKDCRWINFTGDGAKVR